MREWGLTKSITFTEGEGAPHPGLAQGPAKGKTGPVMVKEILSSRQFYFLFISEHEEVEHAKELYDSFMETTSNHPTP